jgi:solute carrier family 66 (lysosomal lysine-arginine transporter), member 1
MDKAIALLKQYFPTVLSSPTTSMESLTSPASRDVLRFISTTSLTSAHLTLNLHIHSFIEACRTIPLAESSTSKGSKSTTVDGDSPPKLWDESHYADLLQRMRRLHSDTLKLPEKHDLVKYTAELTNVAGLLAYPIPEHSPLARYFSHERREAVADQINHAILCTSARFCVAFILVSKYFTRSLRKTGRFKT